MKEMPTQILNATLEYLSKRPYMEVAGLIQALANLQDIKEEKAKEK